MKGMVQLLSIRSSDGWARPAEGHWENCERAMSEDVPSTSRVMSSGTPTAWRVSFNAGWMDFSSEEAANWTTVPLLSVAPPSVQPAVPTADPTAPAAARNRRRDDEPSSLLSGVSAICLQFAGPETHARVACRCKLTTEDA